MNRSITDSAANQSEGNLGGRSTPAGGRSTPAGGRTTPGQPKTAPEGQTRQKKAKKNL